MKSLLKRVVMWAHNHGLVSGSTVLRIFSRFDLWNA